MNANNIIIGENNLPELVQGKTGHIKALAQAAKNIKDNAHLVANDCNRVATAINTATSALEKVRNIK